MYKGGLVFSLQKDFAQPAVLLIVLPYLSVSSYDIQVTVSISRSSGSH